LLRWCLSILAAISAVLFVTAVVLWVQSHRGGEFATEVGRRPYSLQVFSVAGTMAVLMQAETGPLVVGPLQEDKAASAQFTARFSDSAYLAWRDFAICLGPHVYSEGGTNEPTRLYRHGYRLGATAPLWFLVALFFVLPAYSGVRLWQRRRTRRLARPGYCARCGYDLRATPDRCPECGTAAAGGAG
jgi:hypothetical protein